MYPRRDWFPALLFGALEVLLIVGLSRVARADPERGLDSEAWRGVRPHVVRDRATVLEGRSGVVRVELTLASGVPLESHARAPADVVVVMDCSSSVREEIRPAVRDALVTLADLLSGSDSMSFVSFADHGELHWPLGLAAPAVRARAREQEPRRWGAGGTELELGLRLALSQIEERADADSRRIPRVVLISDGLIPTRTAAWRRAVEHVGELVARGAVVSTVAVPGRIDLSSEALARLADLGAGSFYYAAGQAGLESVLARELTLARRTVARDVVVTIEPEPGVRLTDAAGHLLRRSAVAGDRRGDSVQLRPGPLHAGADRRFWLTFKAPTEGLLPRALGKLTLAYRAGARGRHTVEIALPTVTPVADEARHLDSFAPGPWGRSIGAQELGTLQEAVGFALGCHRPDMALGSIVAFRVATTWRNDRIVSPRATEAIASAEQLERMIRALDSSAPRTELGMRLVELGRLTKGR